MGEHTDSLTSPCVALFTGWASQQHADCMLAGRHNLRCTSFARQLAAFEDTQMRSSLNSLPLTPEIAIHPVD